VNYTEIFEKIEDWRKWQSLSHYSMPDFAFFEIEKKISFQFDFSQKTLAKALYFGSLENFAQVFEGKGDVLSEFWERKYWNSVGQNIFFEVVECVKLEMKSLPRIRLDFISHSFDIHETYQMGFSGFFYYGCGDFILLQLALEISRDYGMALLPVCLNQKGFENILETDSSSMAFLCLDHYDFYSFWSWVSCRIPQNIKSFALVYEKDMNSLHPFLQKQNFIKIFYLPFL